MEAFKVLTALLGDLWLGLTALALLIYHSIRLHFRVGRLEDREKDTKDMVRLLNDKLDKIYLHLITHTVGRNREDSNDKRD